MRITHMGYSQNEVESKAREFWVEDGYSDEVVNKNNLKESYMTYATKYMEDNPTKEREVIGHNIH